jgi:hypothetical protein
MELEIFDFKDEDFDKKYYDYCHRVDKWELDNYESYINKEGKQTWTMNPEIYSKAEWLKAPEHQFPKFIKDFMEYLLTSSFLKKIVEQRGDKNPFGNYDCVTMGWLTYAGNKRECLSDTIHNILFDSVGIGDNAHYQGDHEKIVYINFRKKFAEIRRGYAAGLWASKIIENTFSIPKYMRPIVDRLFEEYDEYIKEIV